MPVGGMRVGGGFLGGTPGGSSKSAYGSGFLGGSMTGRQTDLGDDAGTASGDTGGDVGASADDSGASGDEGNPGNPGANTADAIGVAANSPAGVTGANAVADSVAGMGVTSDTTGLTATTPSATAPVGTPPGGDPTDPNMSLNRPWGGQPVGDFAAGFGRGIAGSPAGLLGTALSLATPSPMGMFGLAVRGLRGAADNAIAARANENAAITGFGRSKGGDAVASDEIASTPGVTNASTGPSTGPANSGADISRILQLAKNQGISPAGSSAPAATPALPASPSSPIVSHDPYSIKRFGGLSVGV